MNSELNMVKLLRIFLGLFGVTLAISILFLGMRAVLDVGGSCAEGGPYQIAVHCPKGTAWMIPLSIFVGLGSAALYLVSLPSGAPNIALFFWSGLFGALGWNFLEYGLKPPMDISWLICGIVFEIMALGPLLLLGRNGLREMFWGGETSFSFTTNSRERVTLSGTQKRNILLIHLIAISAGIWLGVWLYGHA